MIGGRGDVIYISEIRGGSAWPEKLSELLVFLNNNKNNLVEMQDRAKRMEKVVF